MQTNVFNENKFISFLNDVNASDTFTVLDSCVNGNNQPVHLVKEYDPSETFAMVYDTYKPECLEIPDTRLGKAWIYVGIYFKDLGTFVYKERYVNLVAEHCTELKTILEDDLYNDLFDHSNRELGSRKSQLTEVYKGDEDLIKDNIKMNKDRMFEELVTGITEDNFEIQKNIFNIYRSSHLTHKYIKDKDQCVTRFIDRYIEENEKEIKDMSLYPIALNKYESELETNEYFKKVRRAYILLNRKFEKAVNVWIVTKEGERVKVFNEFSIDGEEAVIGINANTIHLKDVVQIEYKGYNVTI
ncbi:hypothetical protein [Bacillus toyonensis]|uniref:hypothetical protein n=1 Tax=Bacillus toyonensis TaxID=155322 RepID=UPI002E1B1322|nr:hypothetical protein [Bacillus toyonensis]